MGPPLGGHQNSYGLQPEGLRLRVRCSCKGTGIGVEKADRSETGHDLTDAQAAIRRMASEEPGPGQQYALQAKKHIATLRRARPGIIIEIWWCPAHKGIAGNEKADEWAKIAAEEPDTRGGMAELLGPGRGTCDAPPKVSCKPQAGGLREEVGGSPAEAGPYRMPKRQKPDGTVAGSRKRPAPRYHQLKTGACTHRTVSALG